MDPIDAFDAHARPAQADKPADVLFLEKQLVFAKRRLAIKEARTSLAAFIRLMMFDPSDPQNSDKSLYQRTPQGDLLCKVIEDTLAGKRRRTGVSIPPQHGKTMHLPVMGLAWIMGNDPRAPSIMATYNETRAGEVGDEVKAVMQSAAYAEVFPEVKLHPDSKSKTFMRTTVGGKIALVGLGGTITGRAAKYFFIDDPIKDDEEAQNDGLREKLWNKFFSVAYSRGGNKTAIIVLHTRWHEDDLLGRLCDLDHPERNGRFRGIAAHWTYLNIPGVVTEPEMALELGLVLSTQKSNLVVEQFGEKPMCALWEAEKDLAHFAQWRQGDKRSFDSLVMGKPSPDDGSYFLEDGMVEYDIDDLPDKSELKMFGASDHAVSKKQRRDFTVLGCVGVDKDDVIWVMPDIVWERMETDKSVEALLVQFATHKPGLWWMEGELISKSFGPFLKERMIKERIYTTISTVTPSADKQTRARAIQGRMALRKVRFPRGAPWWSRAKAQMLRFPDGANDDFVDFLAHIGAGLLRMHGPSRVTANDNEKVIPIGSIEWILRSSKKRASGENRRKSRAGW